MKYLLLLLTIFSSPSYADDLSACLKNAKDLGSRVKLQPKKTCYDLIKKHPERIEVSSPSGNYHILAMGSILYLDHLDKAARKLVNRYVLAGDQTDMSNIQKVWIHEKKKRILILEAGNPKGLLTQTLGAISNTAPLRHFKSPILNNVTQVKLLDDREELALISVSAKSIRFINADADSVRYKGGKFMPLLLRQISGEQSDLEEPLDVAISDQNKEIYVLDSQKILVYSIPLAKDSKPKTVIPLDEELKDPVAIELGAQPDSIMVIQKSGEVTKVALKQ
ncbi:MAG TPA: hypothetical protein VNJ08_10870 [Bacteriovoracaceae bacterium]|nr:hypothetical protein [Bacteriovoracaceae bacterium]